MKLDVMRPSWQKVLADLWADKMRTFLVVTSIAVGVFAIGAIMTTYVILSQDIQVSYASSQPANIEVLTTPFDDTLVQGGEGLGPRQRVGIDAPGLVGGDHDLVLGHANDHAFQVCR